MVAELNDTIFRQEVLESNVPVVVDFYATWCGPCKMYSPVIEEMANTYKEKIKVFKVDVDAANETAVNFSIMAVPTTLLFKNGREIARIPGAVPKTTLERQIKTLLE